MMFCTFLVILFLNAKIFKSTKIIAPKCLPPKTTIDLMWNIDNTVSMDVHKDFVRQNIPKLLDEFRAVFPSSRFGLTTFNDEYYHCAEAGGGGGLERNNEKLKQVASSLRGAYGDAYKLKGKEDLKDNYGVEVKISLDENSDKLKNAASKYKADYGDEFFPEDSMGALLVSALNDQIGWRPLTTPNYKRIIVHITDDDFRRPGDRNRVCPSSEPLKPNDGDGNYNNREEDYPTKTQVAKALKEMQIFTVFIILPSQLGLNYANKYRRYIKDEGINGKVFAGNNLTKIVDDIIGNIDKVLCDDSVLESDEEESITTTTTCTTLIFDDEDESAIIPSTTNTFPQNGAIRIALMIVVSMLMLVPIVAGLALFRYMRSRKKKFLSDFTFDNPDNLTEAISDRNVTADKKDFQFK